MTAEIFSTTKCLLGEGPMWHPERGQLFWFDILGKQLRTVEDGQERAWQFDEHVSAAGWMDRDTLMMASETGLYRFDLGTGARELIVALEADDPVTRSNDGRADPWGGFWIGTMGKGLEPGKGKIYRYYRGELRVVVPQVSISNAICFAPGRSVGYWADTVDACIMRQPLDPDTGWPIGEAEVFVDLKPEGLNPDGAVVDAEGCLWNAQWGVGRVARYSPAGEFLASFAVGATQSSCPAFGGADLSDLFVTSSDDGVDEDEGGMTFRIGVGIKGQAEHRVIL